MRHEDVKVGMRVIWKNEKRGIVTCIWDEDKTAEIEYGTGREDWLVATTEDLEPTEQDGPLPITLKTAIRLANANGDRLRRDTLEKAQNAAAFYSMFSDTDVSKYREALAALCHEMWSGWMKWMLEQGTFNPSAGTWKMPPEKYLRWTRQMNTPYADLPDNEQESDRIEADKIIKLIESGSA